METQQFEQKTHRRWLAIAIAGGLLAVAGVSAYFALTSADVSTTNVSSSTEAPINADDESDLSEDPLRSVTAPKTAPLSDDVNAEVERSISSLDAVLAASDEIAQRGDGSAVGIGTIATGWVRGELEAKAREQYDMGYKQFGEGKVTSAIPVAVDLSPAAATITLKVCIDVSGIDVVDSAGNSMKDSLYTPDHPVAHIYGAVFEDGTWKISTHDIPEAQDCAAA